MSQADGYVRIVTRNDTSEAQRSTEQLGDTIHDALDTTPANNMTQAVNEVQNAAEQLSDTMQNSMDAAPAQQMADAVNNVQSAAESLGEAVQDSLDTAPAQQMAEAVLNVQNSAEQLSTAITDATDTTPADNMTGAVGGLKDGISDTGDAALKTGDIIKANLVSEAVTQGIQKLGSALKAAASNAVSMAMSNETAFAKASTLLSGDDLTKYFEGLIEMSNRTGVAFTDLAESMYSALSAGVPQDNVLDFVEKSVKLSKGGFTQTATAIDIVTTALNAYHMEMSEAAHVQDVLITTQNLGKTTVDELASNMGKLIPTANGVATAETTTYLNAMINELGASGSTAEKAMIAATAGTEMAGKKFSEISAMGYDVTDVLKLMDEYAQSTGKSLSDMFSSSEGAKAASILLSNMDGFKSNIDSMINSAGAASDAADTMMDTTAEKIQVAKNQINNLTNTFAEKLLPVIGDTADEISRTVSEADISDVSADVSSFISGTLSFLIANIKLVGSALAGVTTSVVTYKSLMAGSNFFTSFNSSAKSIIASFQGIKTATDSATAAQAANNAVVSANPYMAVVSVISVLIGVFVTLSLSADSAAEKINDLHQSANDFLDAASRSADAAEDIRELTQEYIKLKNAAEETNEVKQRLSEIQDTLLTTYGSEANQIDLVNGKYQDQIGLLRNLSELKSQDAENNAISAYNDLMTAEELEKKIKDEYGNMTGKNLAALVDDKVWELVKASPYLNYQENDQNKNDPYSLAIRSIIIDGDTEAKLKAYEALIEIYKKTGYATDHRDAFNDLVDLYNKYKEKFDENQSILDAYNQFVEPESDYHWGESIAAEEKRKAEARNAAYQANKEKIQQEQADNAEMYKKLRADAKYSYDMGVIDANAYYTQLAVLRDKYLEPDSEEWRSVNVEIKKYFDSLSEEQKKAYESQLEEQKKAAEQSAAARKSAYAEEKSQLEFKLRTNQISEKKYYSELAKIRDKYLDKNSAEWRSAYLETYEYNQKILQANKDALEQLLNDTSDSTLNALNKIVSARDSLTTKLTDFNKTFEKVTETVPETVAVAGKFTITTAEHDEETYKMGADSIEDNIRILEEYGDMLDALKARGADESTLDSILGMDIEEGMEFGTKLLKMSDREWKSYFDSLDRLHKTAADISAKYYQDQVNDLKENFVDKLRQELDGLGTDMYKVGADVAAEFVKGWNESLGTKDLTLGEIMRAVSGGTLSTAPTAAQGMTAAGTSSLGGVTKMMSQILKIPVYIGTSKLEEITVDALNGRIIQTGKNVLLT